MSRKKCKRKVWAEINPIEHAIEGARFTPELVLDQLRMRELAAVDAFAHGHATIQHWNDMVAMLNVCEQMANAKIGPEALPACVDAQAHLVDAQQRFQRIGKMGMTGPGIEAMRQLYQWHDVQRQSISRSEYDRQIKKTVNKVKGKGRDVVELL
jgi:hypothetical protein